MTIIDTIKRALAFYFSVALFLVLLPIVLSYALGYKIDYPSLRVYKTGILHINSQPAGATVFLNGRRHAGLTPTRIEELKPGTYKVEVRRDGFYPWEQELGVKPNMVTRADRIVLFPIFQEAAALVDREIAGFTVTDKKELYCFTPTGLYRMNMDGGAPRRLSTYAAWPAKITAARLSPDGSKIFVADEKRVWIVYLGNEAQLLGRQKRKARVDEVFAASDAIRDVFWYSGSNYIIIVTEKDIKVVELRGGGGRNIVTLYTFAARPTTVYYDMATDSLYFTDAGRNAAGKQGVYLYRLDLRQKLFDQFVQLLMKGKEVEAWYEER